MRPATTPEDGLGLRLKRVALAGQRLLLPQQLGNGLLNSSKSPLQLAKATFEV